MLDLAKVDKQTYAYIMGLPIKHNVIASDKEFDRSFRMMKKIKERIDAGLITTVPDDKAEIMDNEIMKLITWNHVVYYDNEVIYTEIIAEIEEEIDEMRRWHRLEKMKYNLKLERLQKAIRREDACIIKLLRERREIEEDIRRVKNERGRLWAKVQRIDRKFRWLKFREARLKKATRAAAAAAAAALAALNVPPPVIPKPHPYLRAVKADIRNKVEKKVKFIRLPPRIELPVSIMVALVIVFFFLFKNK